MTRRTFYKTTYVVEILSEVPIPDGYDLKDALEEAESGSYSGDVKRQEMVEVDGETMAKLLVYQRSDPGFFRLDIDGEDDEEELDNLQYRYEEASGNTVNEHGNILDESGRLIAPYTPDLAREYLKSCFDDVGEGQDE